MLVSFSYVILNWERFKIKKQVEFFSVINFLAIVLITMRLLICFALLFFFSQYRLIGKMKQDSLVCLLLFDLIVYEVLTMKFIVFISFAMTKKIYEKWKRDILEHLSLSVFPCLPTFPSVSRLTLLLLSLSFSIVPSLTPTFDSH